MASAYKSCVLRIRYNISSADFQAWPKGNYFFLFCAYYYYLFSASLLLLLLCQWIQYPYRFDINALFFLEAVDSGTAHMVDYRNNSKSTYDPNTPLHQNPYIYLNPGFYFYFYFLH